MGIPIFCFEFSAAKDGFIMNIKKQIERLYASSVLAQISLSGAWVAILSARGFSLAQIGFAETVFHIVSIIFEIPSGILADVFGRKKTLLLSCAMRIAGNVVMVMSNSFAMVCASIALHALSYNFSSGSGDALAYDSLKLAGKESRFEKYVSNQLIIYRACEGISTLLAGFSLFIGYRLAYSSGIVLAIAQGAVLAGLCEVRFGETNKIEFRKEVAKCFRESFIFLKKERKAMRLMFANSFAGALDILLLFFLQAKLPMAGIPNWLLGAALLFMQAGGIFGAKAILKAGRARYRAVFIACLSAIMFALALEHTALYPLMTLGGFIAAFADDALQARTDALLHEMFPSEQRATLVSIESFTFSVIMIVLSPLAGIFFATW